MGSLLGFETTGSERRRRWVTRVKPQRVVQRAALGMLHRHPTRNVLVLGQPKSGTTWLRRMLCEVPGYVRWSPPTTEWWNDHPLERSSFDPPPLGYTVTRVHTPPTREHLELVESLGRPAVLVVRDLRDVCVSWAHFIETSTFPMPAELRAMSVSERIDVFIDRLLPHYHDWAEGWSAGPSNLLRVRYEGLVDDTGGEMRDVLDHLRITLASQTIDRIVNKHSFAARTGRAPGQENTASFDRKGIAGDWVTHFTDDQSSRFASCIGALGGSSLYDYGERSNQRSVTIRS